MVIFAAPILFILFFIVSGRGPSEFVFLIKAEISVVHPLYQLSRYQHQKVLLQHRHGYSFPFPV